MKKRIFLGIFIAILFHVFFSGHFRFGNNTINFFLTTVIWAGLYFGRSAGIWTGVFCGIIADLSSYALLGTNVFSGVLIGFLAGSAHKRIDNTVAPRMVLLFALSILDGLLLYLVFILSNFSFSFAESFFSTIMMQAFLNAIAGTFFISIILKVNSLVWGKFSERSQGYSMEHLF